MLYMNDKISRKVNEAKTYCEKNEIDCYYNGESIFEEDAQEDDNMTLDWDSDLIIDLPECDEGIDCKFEKLIEMIEESKNGSLLNDYSFISTKKAYIRINIPQFNFQSSFLSDINFQTSISIENINYIVDILSFFNSFNFKLVEEGMFNKYSPPYLVEDIFIEIIGDSKIKEDHLNIIFDAYFFELKSTFKLTIEPNPWVYEIWDEYEDDEEYKNYETINIRPLVQGAGVKELLNIYRFAFNTAYAEQQILSFSRVIEYVSQTVIRKDLIEKTMVKLSSQRALMPDSTYILELGKIFDDHRDLGKDYQAFKITIETCCDIYELVHHAPEFLKKTKKINLESKSEIIEQAFVEIVNSITSTRNMFAHAKTNYKNKGTECPLDQLDDFSGFMNIVAQQAIRWFTNQKEDTRII